MISFTAIDYIEELNSTKDTLLQRLMRARSMIPPNQYPMPQGDALWEREWNGGVGTGGGDDEDGVGSDDES